MLGSSNIIINNKESIILLYKFVNRDKTCDSIDVSFVNRTFVYKIYLFIMQDRFKAYIYYTHTSNLINLSINI